MIMSTVVLLKLVQCVLAVLCFDDFEATLAQGEAHHLPHRSRVVND